MYDGVNLLEICVGLKDRNESVSSLSDSLIIEEIVERLNMREYSTKKHIAQLERILNGIQDIIVLYTPDHTIKFLNQKGYEFYGKTPENVIGKKCYEIHGLEKLCKDCPVVMAIESKQITSMQRYMKTYDKTMECSCNPLLSEDGFIKYVIVQMRDVSKTLQLENSLKESEKRYRQILDYFPDPVMISQNGKIVFANMEAQSYFETLVGTEIRNIVPDFIKTAEKRINQIMKLKATKTVFDYRIQVAGGKELDVEVSSNYIDYNGKPAILSIGRDITERKKSLQDAARIQKRFLPKVFPLAEKTRMKTLYKPAKTVSGDFYLLEKVHDDLVVGLIGDVSGKGITAAMNISAFNVLFREAVEKSVDPHEIVDVLNKKSMKYFGERYTAVCCFTLDYKKQEAWIVGAGINQFIYKSSEKKWEEHIVKGPFLGMFEDSTFDEKRMSFRKGDQLLFYSDGLETIMENEEFKAKHECRGSFDDLKNDLANTLKEKSTDLNGLMDDCTLLALEIL